MIPALARSYPDAGRTFAEAEETLGAELWDRSRRGAGIDYSATEVVQPAILAYEVAAFRVLEKVFGIEPEWFAGHSLGEIAALTCAGALEFPAALRLVKARGRLMGEASDRATGGMTAIAGVPATRIEEICAAIREEGGEVWLSNRNSGSQSVISGRKISVSRAEKWLRDSGATCTPLRVEGAFHTPLMEPIAGEFALEISRCAFVSIQGRVISSVSGKPYSDPEGMGPALALQLSAPVLWTEALALIRSEGCRTGIETGPGRLLRNLAVKDDVGFGILAFDDPEDASALRSLRGLVASEDGSLPGTDPGCDPGCDLAWVRSCLGMVAATPNREWEPGSHRTGVLIPVSRLRALERLAAGGRGRPGIRAEALSLVAGILRAKGVASGEIEGRMAAITAAGDR